MKIDLTKELPNMDEIVRRRPKQRGGGNGFILGLPGSGKTVTVQQHILSILKNSEDEVAVIDIDGEYVEMAKQMDGQIISIAPDGDFFINPFDMDISLGGAAEYDPVAFKVDFIMALCKATAGLNSLSANQVSIIDCCVRNLYEPYIDSGEDKDGRYDKSKLPTMTAFYELLRGQEGFSAYMLADAMEVFVYGTGKAYSRPTNFHHEKRFVVYDLSVLRGMTSSIHCMIVLNHFWSYRMEAGLNRRKGCHGWVFVDGIESLVRDNAAAEWLQWLYKRSRPYGLTITGIAQSASLILDNPVGRNIFLNCRYVHFLRQSPMDLKALSEICNFTDDQMQFLLQAEPGQALVYDEGRVVGFQKSSQDAPLDLVELKQMDGEPVWVHNLEVDKSFWALAYKDVVSNRMGWLDYSGYGKIWVAYKNKPI